MVNTKEYSRTTYIKNTYPALKDAARKAHQILKDMKVNSMERFLDLDKQHMPSQYWLEFDEATNEFKEDCKVKRAGNSYDHAMNRTKRKADYTRKSGRPKEE